MEIILSVNVLLILKLRFKFKHPSTLMKAQKTARCIQRIYSINATENFASGFCIITFTNVFR